LRDEGTALARWQAVDDRGHAALLELPEEEVALRVGERADDVRARGLVAEGVVEDVEVDLGLARQALLEQLVRQPQEPDFAVLRRRLGELGDREREDIRQVALGTVAVERQAKDEVVEPLAVRLHERSDALAGSHAPIVHRATVETMMRALLPVALALGAGCYNEPRPVCGFFCGPNASCPDDYSCNDEGRCVLVGTPASTVCAGLDASVDAPPDGDIDAMIDAPIDAMVDADVDAMVDAPVDAIVDAGVDAMPDAMDDGGVDAL
jgi:hypothetical protein